MQDYPNLGVDGVVSTELNLKGKTESDHPWQFLDPAGVFIKSSACYQVYVIKGCSRGRMLTLKVANINQKLSFSHVQSRRSTWRVPYNNS